MRALWFIFFLCLVSSFLFAAQSQTVSTDLYMVWAEANPMRDMSTDLSVDYSSRLTLSSGGDAPATVFIPRGLSSGDMPSQIYSCPGKFDFQTTVASTFANSGISAVSSYPLQRACPNLLYGNGLGCAVQNPWGSVSSSMNTQWIGDANLMNTIKEAPRVSRRVYDDSYSRIETTGQNVNADYYPIFNDPSNYPNQRSEASMLCIGAEYASLGTSQLSTIGGSQSPVSIVGHPPQATNWNLPTFTSEGTYTLSSGFSSDECVGSIHILPDYSADTYDSKYHFADATGTSALNPEPLAYTINIVDPKTCDISATISPADISGELEPGREYSFNVHASNPSELFGMVPKGVTMVAPSNGWSVRQGASPNGFGSVIGPKSTSQLKIVATSPSPLTGAREACFNITFETDVPLCDGNICKNSTVVCVDLNPELNCKVQTNSTTDPKNLLKPGEDLLLTTECYNGNRLISCPQLTWTAINFPDDKISLTEAPPSDPQDQPEPFVPDLPPRRITTNVPLPEAVLWTYADPPDSINSEATENGDVIVAGEGFECSVSGTSAPINLEPNTFPDYVPVLSVQRISGRPEDNNEVFRITWGTKNEGPADARTWSRTTLASQGIFQIMGNAIVPALKVDETRHTSQIFNCLHPGMSRIRVVVDSTNRIREEPPMGELNNIKDVILTCGNALACYDLV